MGLGVGRGARRRPGGGAAHEEGAGPAHTTTTTPPPPRRGQLHRGGGEGERVNRALPGGAARDAEGAARCRWAGG